MNAYKITSSQMAGSYDCFHSPFSCLQKKIDIFTIVYTMIRKLYEAVVKMIHTELLGKITTFSWTLQTSASKTASGLRDYHVRQQTPEDQDLLQKRTQYLRQLEGDAQWNGLSFPVIPHLELHGRQQIICSLLQGLNFTEVLDTSFMESGFKWW